jgi:hypothetical protein
MSSVSGVIMSYDNYKVNCLTKAYFFNRYCWSKLGVNFGVTKSRFGADLGSEMSSK